MEEAKNAEKEQAVTEVKKVVANVVEVEGLELDEIQIPEPEDIKVTPPTKVENGFTSTQPSSGSLGTEGNSTAEPSSNVLMNGHVKEEKEPINGYVPSPVKPAPAPESISEPSTQISFLPKSA